MESQSLVCEGDSSFFIFIWNCNLSAWSNCNEWFSDHSLDTLIRKLLYIVNHHFENLCCLFAPDFSLVLPSRCKSSIVWWLPPPLQPIHHIEVWYICIVWNLLTTHIFRIKQPQAQGSLKAFVSNLSENVAEFEILFELSIFILAYFQIRWKILIKFRRSLL